MRGARALQEELEIVELRGEAVARGDGGGELAGDGGDAGEAVDVRVEIADDGAEAELAGLALQRAVPALRRAVGDVGRDLVAREVADERGRKHQVGPHPQRV